MSERHGTVWYGDRRVGTLRDPGDATLRFAYRAEWLNADAFPISIRVPLSLGDEEVDAHAFFQGLLPEGRVRQRICRQRGIDPQDDAGLLFAIGEDCAGALSVLPGEAEPEPGRAAPVPVSAAAIDRLVLSRGEEGMITSEPQRFSLAGVQEKETVIFDGHSYWRPDRANPSSHILKFETVPRVCFAECIAGDMARRLGLPVVTTEFLTAGDGSGALPYLRIERYDRERDESGQLRRLHQEDILQALGHSTIFKYQRDGGPSIREVAKLLREHTARPVEALGLLRDWQMFNYLTGNWDGHGKNLALLYADGEAVPRLAPFYDLVAIEFFNLVRPQTWSREMAFSIGEQHVPERVGRTDWERFARDLGMPPKRLLARVQEMAEQLPAIAGKARQGFADAHGDEPVYDRLEESIGRRCKWTLESVCRGIPT